MQTLCCGLVALCLNVVYRARLPESSLICYRGSGSKVLGACTGRPSQMDIAERLRSIRKRLGYTQREAALAAGMSPQYLSDLETGRIRNPSLETLERLAQAYGMGADELIGRGASTPREGLPEGLQELLADPHWEERIDELWVETLLRIRHAGVGLQTKEEFLEAYLALRRILDRPG